MKVSRSKKERITVPSCIFDERDSSCGRRQWQINAVRGARGGGNVQASRRGRLIPRDQGEEGKGKVGGGRCGGAGVAVLQLGLEALKGSSLLLFKEKGIQGGQRGRPVKGAPARKRRIRLRSLRIGNLVLKKRLGGFCRNLGEQHRRERVDDFGGGADHVA